MATFRDRAGREWVVTIDVLQLERVRESTGFEIGKLLAEEMRRYVELSTDPELLCRVLFALCADQARGLRVTREDFFRALAGDELFDAWVAFQGAYLDFCPNHVRKPLAEVVAAATRGATATTNGPAGNSPDSSGSTLVT